MIPLTQIKAELANMWHEVTRSSVLTLVAYTESADRATQISDLLDRLAGQHPSRAITIVVESTNATPTASVMLHTHEIGQTKNMIGAEQIVIYLPVTEMARVAEYVQPLLLSDMPVFVWWAGQLPGNERLIEDLSGLGDHLVFDSAVFAQPSRDLTILADLIRQYRSSKVNYKAYHDFNWERLTPWRAAISQSFDPPHLEYLEHISQARIGYVGHADLLAPSTQAYLLVGWLAALLDWTPESFQIQPSGGAQCLVRSPRRAAPISIEIAPFAVTHTPVSAIPPTAPVSHPIILEGALLFVELIAEVNGAQILFRTALSDDGTKSVSSVMHLDGERALPRTMPMEVQDEVMLLAGQLTRIRYDHIYEDAVLSAQAIIAAKRGG